jgi:ubiquinone/menaquinone biosynthesis C-methylase UbiE
MLLNTTHQCVKPSLETSKTSTLQLSPAQRKDSPFPDKSFNAVVAKYVLHCVNYGDDRNFRYMKEALLPVLEKHFSAVGHEVGEESVLFVARPMRKL